MDQKEGLEIHAVEMMRSIRAELSRKLKTMTYEEQREFIKDQLTPTARDTRRGPTRSRKRQQS